MIEIPKNDIEQKKRESVGQQPNILDVFINAGLPLQINQENNTSMEQSFNVSGTIKGPDEFGNFILNYTGTKRVLKSDGTLLCDKCFSEVVVCDYVYWCKNGKDVYILDPENGELRSYDLKDRIEIFKETEESLESLTLKLRDFYMKLTLAHNPSLGSEHREDDLMKTENVKIINEVILGLYEYVYHGKLTARLVVKNSKVWNQLREDVTFQRSFPELYLAMFELDKYRAVRGGKGDDLYYVKSEGKKCICYKLQDGKESVHFLTEDFVVDYQNNIIVTQNGKKMFLGSEYPKCEFDEIAGPDKNGNYVGKIGGDSVFFNKKGEILDLFSSNDILGDNPGFSERFQLITGPDENGCYILKHKKGERLLSADGKWMTDILGKIFPVDEKGNYKVIDIKLEGCNLINSKGEKKYDGWYKNIELKGDEYERIENKEIEIKYLGKEGEDLYEQAMAWKKAEEEKRKLEEEKMRQEKEHKEAQEELGQEKFDSLLNLYERYDMVYGFSEGLALVRKDGKFGYIDKSGNEVVACKYDYVWSFSEGLAEVKKDEKCGYIDKNGNEVIACKYDYASIFSEGLALVRKNRKYGYIDKSGNEVIACKYDYVCSFSEGLASVEKDGKYWYIDKSGNEVIACKYGYAGDFSEGLAIVKKDGKYGYIDKNGNEVIACKYDVAWSFGEGLARVEKDGKYGYIDKNGNEVVACKYDYIENFREGLAVVRKDGKYGYIDKNGNEVVACEYDNALSFGEGLARVKKDEKCGYIDKKGNEVIACKYDDAWSFREGLASVEKDGKHGYIDKSGNEVIACKYDEVLRLDGAILAKEGKRRILFDLDGKMRKNEKRKEAQEGLGQEKFDSLLNLYERYDIVWSFSEGLARVNKDGKYGYIDKNGNEVIACKYDDACSFSEGLARVRKDGKFGYIDKSGNEVIACKYDDAWSFGEGLARVEKDGKYGYIDKSGNEVIACKYGYAGDFSEGLAEVRKDGKWLYIDKSGNEVISCEYDDVWSFSEGLALVEKDGKYGYIDKSGNEVIACKYDDAWNFSEGLARVEKDGKYGYIDKNGNEVVACKYDNVWDFSEGLARIEKDGKYGYIDKNGNEVVACKYDDVSHLDGAILAKEGKMTILFDLDGKMRKNEKRKEAQEGLGQEKFDSLLNLYERYDTVGYFSEGLAVVEKDGKCGYIDKNGNEVVACKYDYINEFCEGLARVTKDGKYGYIDKSGNEVVACKYDYINEFSEGLARVKKDGKYGYIDKSGNEVIACKYGYTGDFSEGLARVRKDGKFGYIDKSGNEVIACKYDDAWSFSEGLARVRKDGKYGYIDKSGNEVVACKYDEVLRLDGAILAKEGKRKILFDLNGKMRKNKKRKEGQEKFDILLNLYEKYDRAWDFREGLAKVRKNDKYGYVDKNGNEVVACKYDYIENFREGLARVVKDGKNGYIDKSGNEVVACKYDDAGKFREGLASVEKNGKYGYIDKSGNEVVACKYDDAWNFSEGLARVGKDGKYGYIDKNGNEVVACKYDDVTHLDGAILAKEGKRTILFDLDGKIIKERAEIIDTPAEVLEFRRGFVDGIKKNDDVTTEKLEKIVKIGEKLVKSKEFHFEKSEYGNIGVLKLGGRTMKFLNIAHPQDFNNQLTHKIKDESLNKNYDYKQELHWRCHNTQDLVYNKAMPGGSAEDAGIVELLDKVKDSTGLGQLTRAEMENTVRGILKNYCNQNGVNFNNNNDYILLYMYLMGPKGGYGWQWLSDLQNSSYSSFICYENSRGFNSDIYDFKFASFFLGLLVDDLGEKKENHSIELPAGLPDYAYEVDKNFKNETGDCRNPEMMKKIDEAVLKMREDGILKTKSKNGGVYTTINFPNEKPIHFLEPDLIKHSDEDYKYSYDYSFGGNKNIHKDEVSLRGMRGKVDEWKNEKLKKYVKQSGLSLPKELEIKEFTQKLADFVNSEYKLNISSEKEQTDLFCRAMNSIGIFWLADCQNSSHSYFLCDDFIRGFYSFDTDSSHASFFLTDYLL